MTATAPFWTDFIPPKTFNVPFMAFDSPWSTSNIVWAISKTAKRLPRHGAHLLECLIRHQNKKTGQLNVTNETLSDELGLGLTATVKLMRQIKEFLFPFVDFKHYWEGECRKRRHININWVGVLYNLREIQRAALHDPTWKYPKLERQDEYFLIISSQSPLSHSSDLYYYSSLFPSSCPNIINKMIEKNSLNFADCEDLVRNDFIPSPFSGAFHEIFISDEKKAMLLKDLSLDDEDKCTEKILSLDRDMFNSAKGKSLDDPPPPAPPPPEEEKPREKVKTNVIACSPVREEKPKKVNASSFQPTNRYKDKIAAINQEAIRRAYEWIEQNKDTVDSHPKRHYSYFHNFMNGFEDEAIGMLKAIGLLTEQELAVDMNTNYWAQKGWEEDRDEYLKIHPEEATLSDKDRWREAERPPTREELTKRKFINLQNRKDFDHIVNVQVDPRDSAGLGETQWETLKRRMTLNPNYDPFKFTDQRWHGDCHWMYAEKDEERRDRDFRASVRMYFKNPTKHFTEKTLKLLVKAREMADAAYAVYAEWVGAQYRIYGRKIMYTHLCSKHATNIYKEFKAGGWNIPTPEGADIVLGWSRKGKEEWKQKKQKSFLDDAKEFFDSVRSAQNLVEEWNNESGFWDGRKK